MCLDSGAENRTDQKRVRSNVVIGVGIQRGGWGWGGVQSEYAWNPLGNGADRVQIPTTPPHALPPCSPARSLRADASSLCSRNVSGTVTDKTVDCYAILPKRILLGYQNNYAH
ncbi:hypothetical protein ALC56_09690 [Trachymyrmex septentrionalis]|uniref:Uncharacterized protein n=1 Tax=Trachymyrmex septentrionalis TaxID=34720 RepID=A0A195F751_9HYME|nr:hypothetical protein ALC56_09690 [Trachymyrmex septentrionalis]